MEHRPVVNNGKVEWEIDRSERKKTGSYYTPQYIVKYIVENTLGPLVKEITEKAEAEIEELKGKIKASRGYNRKSYEQVLKEKKKEIREQILNLKVLDPAMGSGHFLVEATEFLANSIAGMEERFSDTDEDNDVDCSDDAVQELKRHIVERSIYGVDKNSLATELAKLSLWLHTVAKGEPLSFLDHHLRSGDSLIGIDVEQMETPVFENPIVRGLFESHLVQNLAIAIGHLSLIKELRTESREDVQTKKSEWREVKLWIDKYRKAANVWLSTYFGNKVTDEQYIRVLNAAASNDMEKVEDEPFFRKAQELADEKSFFHWELEFPDVFRDEHGKEKDDRGFDAVIMNPPYVEARKLKQDEVDYLRNYYRSIGNRVNIFSSFIEKGVSIVSNQRRLGIIVHRNIIRSNDHRNIRLYILESCKITHLISLGNDVFDNVTGEMVILILAKEGAGQLRNSHKICVGQVNFDKTLQIRAFNQSVLLKLPDFRFNIYLTESIIRLFHRIKKEDWQSETKRIAKEYFKEKGERKQAGC